MQGVDFTFFFEKHYGSVIQNKPENPFQTMTSQNIVKANSKQLHIYSFESNLFQIDLSWYDKVDNNRFVVWSNTILLFIGHVHCTLH